MILRLTSGLSRLSEVDMAGYQFYQLRAVKLITVLKSLPRRDWSSVPPTALHPPAHILICTGGYAL